MSPSNLPRLPLALLAAAALATGAVPSRAPARAAEDRFAEPVRITAVIDGDTVVVPRPGNRRGEKVRLLNVDTPEYRQRGYREGTAALRALIAKRPVRLVFPGSGGPRRDRYGRLLAYLFIGETNLNVEMVRSGWSRYYVRFGPGTFPREFAAAEREAREAGRGLWAGRTVPAGALRSRPGGSADR